MADAQRLHQPVGGHRGDQPAPCRLPAGAKRQRLDDLRAAEVEHQARVAAAQLVHDERPLRLADDGVRAREVRPHAAAVVPVVGDDRDAQVEIAAAAGSREHHIGVGGEFARDRDRADRDTGHPRPDRVEA
ncbi:MAG: hypothetical protein E6G41_09155 [Actinobacteria bacterium]|nr:MAG: hypothetical protein E6G41_09155 [Actinomycetota bacterium]